MQYIRPKIHYTDQELQVEGYVETHSLSNSPALQGLAEEHYQAYEGWRVAILLELTHPPVRLPPYP